MSSARSDDTLRTAPRPERFCLNCDNRHGCRTPEPPCLALVPGETERKLGGRELMTRRGLLPRCRQCGLFRQCWTEERYQRRLRT